MPDHDSPLADLLMATARGDVEAFAGFYDASRRRVFGLTLKILGDISAAEEAALEAYAYAWHNALRYDRSKGGALQWILIVARSRALSDESASRCASTFTSGFIAPTRSAATSTFGRPTSAVVKST